MAIMDQRARMASLDAFRNDEVQLLVCSDVAARGLDIPDVSHVINYDAPHHAEDYVHRIGRTGRAGKRGAALTIVTRADQKSLDEIEKLIGNKIAYSEMGTPEVDEAPATERPRQSERGRDRNRHETRGSRGDRPERITLARNARRSGRAARMRPSQPRLHAPRRRARKLPADAAATATSSPRSASSVLAITFRASCCGRPSQAARRCASKPTTEASPRNLLTASRAPCSLFGNERNGRRLECKR